MKIIGALPAVETVTTGYRIFPFLARIDPPPAWRICSDEIAEVMEAAVDDLAGSEAHGGDADGLPSLPGSQPAAFFRVGPHRVWGATYRILQSLLPRLRAGGAADGGAGAVRGEW